MKTPSKKKHPKLAKAEHIVQSPVLLVWQHIYELQAKLRSHHSNLAGLYAYGCGEKNLQNPKFTKRAQKFKRSHEDELRLEWTVSNIQVQINALQKELFQLLRSL